jgi:hypothetical protein
LQQQIDFASTFSQDGLELLLRLPEKGIHVAVASFGSFYESIQGVLREALRPFLEGKDQNKDFLEKAVNSIYIVTRGSRKPFYDFDPEEYDMIQYGKNPMLDNILHYVQKKEQKITKPNLLLIDDDANNIHLANKDQYQTLLVTPASGFKMKTAQGRLFEKLKFFQFKVRRRTVSNRFFSAPHFQASTTKNVQRESSSIHSEKDAAISSL